jgi:hypothetical protein
MLNPACKRIVYIVFLSFFPVLFSVVGANHLEPRHQPHHRDTDHRHGGYKQNQWRQPYLSTYLGLGLGFGGDEVGRFEDNFGFTDKIYGGGGLLLEAGLNLSVDQDTDLRLTGGYQFDGTSRGNGSSLFDRLRFDLTMLRRFGAHDFGVGVTAHTSVGYSCDINSICEGDVEFDHAIGYTLEYAIRAGGYRRGSGQGLRLGVRYTGINYTPRLQDADIVSGDSLTGFVGVAF